MYAQKIKTHLSLSRIMAIIALGLLILLRSSSPLQAQTVTQGYGSNTSLQRGTLVSLSPDDATKVEPATESNAERLHGIVVDPNDAPVTLSGDGQAVFVATVGRYEALVSNQNGSVSAGDYLAVSSLEGIATKASANHPTVVGRAVAPFTGNGDSLGQTDVKIGNETKQISFGRIMIDIGVGNNPIYRSQDSNVPQALRRITEAIAGKQVSAARTYMALVIFLVTAFVSSAMLYAGIRSSIMAVGRNPLSRQSIMRGLVQVTLTSLIIFISGTFGVYLLLKL